MRIDRCFNVEDFRRIARRKLPAPFFHYIDGGADDEITLRRNTNNFDDYMLHPRMLRDVAVIDASTHVLGAKIEWPVFCAPTGMSRLFHHDGERAVARAAARAGTFYSLSTVSSVSLEEVGALTSGPKVFQIYIHRDRSLTLEFVERARAAGFDALCLTVDMAVAGNRERDLVTGMTMPPKFTPKSLMSFVMSPEWTFNYLTHEKFGLANVRHRIAEGSQRNLSLIDYVNSQFERSVTWDDAARIIEAWGGPFAIKGIVTVDDARRAADVGASAIMVSNHGGRQLDGTVSSIDVIADIADAVGGRIEIILDGGVRRGTHVLKALARGATACSIGRPYLYGLAAAGEAGVSRVLSLLRAEVERDMALLGCAKISDITADYVTSR